MSDLRRKPRRFEVSGQGLKYLSAGLLLLYNIGRTVLERGIIRLDSYIQTELLDAMAASPGLTGWVGAASVIGLLGGIATPLYAFLLVEVFLHTSNYSKYLLRVAVLAGTSEFVYDFAMTGNFSEFSQQNPALGLAVCLIQLYIMQMLE